MLALEAAIAGVLSINANAHSRHSKDHILGRCATMASISLRMILVLNCVGIAGRFVPQRLEQQGIDHNQEYSGEEYELQ